jgi:CHAT domain-containing protein
MKNDTKLPRSTQGNCLTDEEIYRYIVQLPRMKETSLLEPHLAGCPRCREELASVLKLLYPESPESTESVPEPSAAEIEDTVRFIQKVSGEETRSGNPWIRGAAAAAAAIVLIGAGLWGLVPYRDRLKSDSFYAQARTELERAYEAQSPSDLRLDLPFRPTAVSRSSPSAEALHRAETFFHQALAVREGLRDAHLGLASIYLSKSQFSLAEEEFQKVLSAKNNDPQALTGRGVTRFEQAKQTADALQRSSLLSGALEDFDAALRQNPSSVEALYNKAWVLFEIGRHNEALQEINSYLSKDSGSIWAGKLKSLRGRINFTNSRNVEKEVSRAAAARDSAALSTLASLAPSQVPRALQNALRQSLAIEGLPIESGKPRAADLVWASQVMELAYGAVAGDRSYHNLLKFYDGLSPPQRRTKKLLDAEFEKLVGQYEKKGFKAVLRSSQSLERRFAALQDTWQLLSIYHLRGNCYYYGPADFQNALASYQRMLSMAERTGSPDLIARALGSLTAVCLERRLLDQAQAYGARLKELADKFQLTTWQAYASLILGEFYRHLNRLEDSQREYTSALSRAYPLNYELVLLNSLEGLGSVLDRMGRLRDAQRFYAEAVHQQENSQKNITSPDKLAISTRKLNLLYRQGDLFLRLGELDKAETFFNQSLRFSAGSMRELEARNRLGLAELYLTKKRFERAGPELEGVFSIASSGQYPEVEWQARYLKGKLLDETGAESDALANYENAVAIIEKMRAAVTPGDLRQSFLNHRFDPYKAIVSLLYHSLDDKQKAREYAERSKAITLREYLRAARLETAPGAQLSASGAVSPHGAYRTATLDYFLTDDEIFLFFDGRTRREAVSIKINRADLEQQVGKFLECVRENNATLSRTLSRKLEEELLGPVRTALEADSPDVLLILPDGPLHMLPFAALEDSNGRYLLEKTALVYAPSRSVFRYSMSLNRDSASRARTMLLLDGSANLSGAGAELAHLSQLYGGGARLLNAKELADCGRLAAQYEILHFAGHAENSGGSASLVFRSAPGGIRLDSHAIATWKLTKTRLVNLAGCSTGIGPRAEGESPWGLVPAFLSAGAPSVLVSLMTVDDAATESLNSRFYELLIRGTVSKAKALQQAQLALLSSERKAGNPKPSSWAPYVLVGDPR